MTNWIDPDVGEVDKAYRRLALLKQIVDAERRRLEDYASSRERRIRFGLSDEGDTKKESNAKVKSYFNELLVLLDFIHISHMAASFEFEIRQKLSNYIGEGRLAVVQKLSAGDWTANLIRNQSELQGLKSIFDLLNVTDSSAVMIRDDRNVFCHGFRVGSSATIKQSVEETLESLRSVLGILNRV